MVSEGVSGSVGFIIKGLNSILIAVGASQLFDISVLLAELRGAREGLVYVTSAFGARKAIIEEEFRTC